MDWIRALYATGGLALLVLVQIPLMQRDKHWDPAQVRNSARPQDYAALVHGGFLIDPSLALVLGVLAGKYTFDVSSRAANYVLGLVAAVTLAFVLLWESTNEYQGDCYAHDGTTTLAGLVHAVFFATALNMIAQLYLGLTQPVIQGGDLLLLSGYLSAFLVVGVMKFDPRWSWTKGAVIQVLLCEFALWGFTVYRY